MSKISIEGNASGTGTLTIAAPNTNSNYTLTLPTETGTVLTDGGGGAGNFATLTVNSNNISAENSLGFRNRIINGDMRIDQRNAGASVTFTGSYTLDRFYCGEDTDGTISAQQVTDGPTGFTNSMKFTVGTADATLGATQYVYFRQAIEGYNFADCEFGTANAKTVTVSFWVKSSITGTFGGNLASTGHDRSYAFAYTINSANTWEYKTATITGDTSGTWNKTNSVGAFLHFCLASGSTYLQSTGSWAAGTYLGPTGQTNLMATSGNTFNITGVQLEVGSVATPFERRPYGQELALCQRYFQRLGSLSGNYVGFGSGRGAGTTSVVCYLKYANTVRSTPTISQSNTGINYPTQATVTSLGPVYYGTDSASVELVTANTVTSGTAVLWLGDNNSSAYVDISAEL